jgi:predicted Zn-dependent protease
MLQRIMLTLVLLLGATAAHALSLNLDKLTNIIGKAKDLKPVETPDEIEIGKGVAANLLGAAPLVQDEKLQAYVESAGGWCSTRSAGIWNGISACWIPTA